MADTDPPPESSEEEKEKEEQQRLVRGLYDSLCKYHSAVYNFTQSRLVPLISKSKHVYRSLLPASDVQTLDETTQALAEGSDMAAAQINGYIHSLAIEMLREQGMLRVFDKSLRDTRDGWLGSDSDLSGCCCWLARNHDSNDRGGESSTSRESGGEAEAEAERLIQSCT